MPLNSSKRQASLASLGRDAQVDAVDLDEFDVGLTHLW